MTKPIDNYLDSVIELYKGFMNRGELIPLEFNFPAFEVTKGNFNFYALETLSERVRIGVDSGIYGLQKDSNEINYDKLISYNKNGVDKSAIGVLIEKVLPEKIKQDMSITASETRNGALLGCCVKTMDYKVEELISLEYFTTDKKLGSREIKKESQANYLFFEAQKRIDFIATLVSMKEILPQIHRKVLESLDDRKNMVEDSIKSYSQTNNLEIKKSLEMGIKQNLKIVRLIGDLKESAANPNANVLNRALEINPSLNKAFIERYPLVMKEVLKENAKKGKTFSM